LTPLTFPVPIFSSTTILSCTTSLPAPLWWSQRSYQNLVVNSDNTSLSLTISSSSVFKLF
jgi:hypothetical protein